MQVFPSGVLIEIAIPIYNALEDVKACLHSVRAHSPTNIPVWLLDDGSSDPLVQPFCEQFCEAHPHFRYHRFPTNEGFLRTANFALSQLRTDVLLLNSDTVVTPGWVERLQACAQADGRTGIVSPLSNCAWILSVPYPAQVSPRPGSATEIAAQIAKHSRRAYPEIPTGVGFCMLIRRPVIDRIGLFDPAFSPGYGEEVDFSFRALEAGFRIRCADDTFVYHRGSASFGTDPRREQYLGRSYLLICAFWPDRAKTIESFAASQPFAYLAEKLEI